MSLVSDMVINKEKMMMMMMVVVIVIIIIIIIIINVSDIPGNHDVKELQKTAILGTAHILRKVLT